MRLGILGGSFDPVHHGHLRLADSARCQAHLDLVLLMPAARQPLKPEGPRATDADRIAMLRLATRGGVGLEVEPMEIERGGVSFTFQTLRMLRDRDPDAELFFLMGADSLAELPRWREPQEVLALAMPLVVGRPGHPPPDLGPLRKLVSEDRCREIEVARIEMPPLPISSSEIRRRIAARQAWRWMTTDEVADYIERHQLYATRRG